MAVVSMKRTREAIEAISMISGKDQKKTMFTESGDMVFESYNREGLSCRVRIPYSGLTLDAIKIPDRLKELEFEDDDIELSIRYGKDINPTLVVKSGKSKIQMVVETSVPLRWTMHGTPLRIKDLKGVIEIANVTLGDDENPISSSIFINKTSVSSTNSYMVSITQALGSDKDFAINEDVASCISRTCREEEDVKFTISDNVIFWEFRNVTYGGSLVSGVKRPNFEVMASGNNGPSFKINSEELLTLIKTCGVAVKGLKENAAVKLKTNSDGTITVSAQNEGFISIERIAPCQDLTGDIDVMLSYQLLLPIARSIFNKSDGKADVCIEQNTKTKFIVIEPSGIEYDTVFCVAPIIKN